jgi:hypothetical protein
MFTQELAHLPKASNKDKLAAIVEHGSHKH